MRKPRFYISKSVILAKSTIILGCVDSVDQVCTLIDTYMLNETEQKRRKKKMRNSRHIPCPDWIQNVTVTCK